MAVTPVPRSASSTASQRPVPHQIPVIPAYDVLVMQRKASRLAFGKMLLN